MTVFRGKNWVKGAYEKSKNALKMIQLQDLAARIQKKQSIHMVFTWLNTYKFHCLKAVGALGLLVTVSVSGNYYVKTNTVEVFHVFVGDQASGIVSDPKVVEDFVKAKYKEIEKEYPGIHMALNTDEITFDDERAFKAESDDKEALRKLDGLLEAQAYGVELRVDDKLIAIVRDKETANKILKKIKQKYIPEEKGKARVAILSYNAHEEAPVGNTTLESIDFIQDVELTVSDIDPNEIMEPDEVLHKLETGDVAPLKYIVQEGDCVSCIAQKFGISKNVIYDNNPWIVDDMIFIGDELDLTVLQPTLSVKTIEQFVEDQEIQYDTIYHKDPSMRAGKIRVLSPGKNGLKKVTYQLVKVNGQIMDEQFVDEEVILEPIAAVAKKGTKVILGEGTGRFSWPVIGARLTSSYGKRWGRMHKGVDLASSNRNIIASDNGKVIFAGVKNDYGNVVVLDHLNGYQTLYAHLSKISVSEGNTVEKGEKIGVMGNTGDSHGVHLHFEVHKSGSYENPMKYLRR